MTRHSIRQIRLHEHPTIASRVGGMFRLRLRAFAVLGVLAAVGGGLLYMTIINRVATSGFEIKSLEQKADTLRQENRKLELEAAELQSLAVVRTSTTQLGLTEVAKIEYLSAAGAAVARK